jgi:murein DD-endopeptidase MepM/ murein hydrolase activator NlpD
MVSYRPSSPSRIIRDVGRLITIALGGMLLLSVGPAGAAQRQTAPGPVARAFAIQVAVPGQGGASAASISAPPDAVGVGGSFAFPGDGSVVSAGSVTSGAFAAPGASATASASAEASSISLFRGEVTIASVTARTRASANKRTSSADPSGSSVNGLVVQGQAVASGPGTRVSIGDWAHAVTLQQGTSSLDTVETKGARAFVSAIHFRVTADHNGIPAGTEVIIGYAEASAQASIKEAAPVLRRKAPATRKRARAAAPKKQVRGPGVGPEQPSLVRRPPPEVTPRLTAGRYVFPVYGPSSFVDTFGAPRATVASGWHHGEDIFAPLGAPILAVADGTVFSVGWNRVGGWRLWLRDREGNEFYYAHLSAFSPAAVNGTEVEAGTVLGFIGNTGDAEGTPYHLHFEIHPVGLLHLGYDGAVNPYPYLIAWKRLKDIEFAAVAGWAPPVAPSSKAPKPGAILLSSTDISSADGLDPGSLQRVLRQGETGISLKDAP